MNFWGTSLMLHLSDSAALIWNFHFLPQTAVLCSDFILVWWEIFSREISGQWDSPCELSFSQTQRGCLANCLSLRNVTSYILLSSTGLMVEVLAWIWHYLTYIFYSMILAVLSPCENLLNCMHRNLFTYFSRHFMLALWVYSLSFFNLICEILNSSKTPCCC